MSGLVKQIDRGLRRYYEHKSTPYVNKEGIGKFAEWAEDNEYDTDAITADFNNVDPKEMECVDFDENFPITDSTNKTQEIFKILNVCYKEPTAFFNSPDLPVPDEDSQIEIVQSQPHTNTHTNTAYHNAPIANDDIYDIDVVDDEEAYIRKRRRDGYNYGGSRGNVDDNNNNIDNNNTNNNNNTPNNYHKNSHHHKSANAKICYKWQWDVGPYWKDYKIKDSRAIELQYGSSDIMYIDTNNTLYQINLVQLKQVNTTNTSKKRKIRRVPMNHTDYSKKGDSHKKNKNNKNHGQYVNKYKSSNYGASLSGVKAEEKEREFEVLALDENEQTFSEETPLNEQTILDIQQIVDEELSNMQSKPWIDTASYLQFQNIMYCLGGGDQTYTHNAGGCDQDNSQQSNGDSNGEAKDNKDNSYEYGGGGANRNGNGNGNGKGDGNGNNKDDDDDKKDADDEDENEDEEEDEEEEEEEEEKKENNIKMTSKLNCTAPAFIPNNKKKSLLAMQPIHEERPLISGHTLTLSSAPILQTEQQIYSSLNLPQIPLFKQLPNTTNTAIPTYYLDASYSESNTCNNTSWKPKSHNQRKKKKKKKRDKLKVQQMYIRTNNQPYFEKINIAANQKIYLSNSLIQDIRNKTVQTSMGNIRNYMNAMVEIHLQTKSESELQTASIDFGFIDKETKQHLYCSMQQQKTIKYNALQPVMSQFIFKPVQSQEINTIKRKINAQSIENILINCDWRNIPIINRKNDRFRITASITKEQLCQQTAKFNQNDLNVVPIVAYDKKKIVFAWIIKIHSYIYIALSLEYNQRTDNITINGIYVDREYLMQQHYLAYPPHMNDCKCLDEFESTINDINVSNPDCWLNKVKDYEAKFKKKVEHYENDSNELIFQSEMADSPKEIISNRSTTSTASSVLFYSNNVSPPATTAPSVSSSDQQYIYPILYSLY